MAEETHQVCQGLGCAHCGFTGRVSTEPGVVVKDMAGRVLMTEEPEAETTKWVSTAIKIDRDLLDRLKQEADSRVLGRNLMINMAIKRFLDELIPIDHLTRREGNHAQIQGEPLGSTFDNYLGGGSRLRPPVPDTITADDPDADVC